MSKRAWESWLGIGVCFAAVACWWPLWRRLQPVAREVAEHWRVPAQAVSGSGVDSVKTHSIFLNNAFLQHPYVRDFFVAARPRGEDTSKRLEALAAKLHMKEADWWGNRHARLYIRESKQNS